MEEVSSSDFIPTGKAVFYLHSCPVLAWLYVNGHLVVDPHQEYISSGVDLERQRWADKRTLDLGPYGAADWVTGTRSSPVIHEGSRSAHHNNPKRAQLRHYLWAAKKLYNIDAIGELHLRRGGTERVLPDHLAVESDHEQLRRMVNSPPPAPVRIAICKGCSNSDWCWP